jgi:hypothetical protein
MNNTNPADWTNAEIARWMAERDGWRVEMQGEYWSGVIYHARNANTGEQYTSQTKDFVWKQALKNTNYPRSLDAVVEWLGRMGLGWMRYMNMDCVAVSNGTEWFTCAESDTCSTSRALCNAGAAAWLAGEAK